MLKNLFNIIITLIIIVIIGSFLYQLFVKPVKDHNNVAEIISLNKDTSKIIVDNKGQLHAQKEVVYIPTFSIAESLYKKEIDSLKNELGLKTAKIAAMATVNTKTEVSFKPEVVRDTSKFIILRHKDKWTDLSLTTDTSKMSKLIYRDSLVFAVVKQPYGFLKMKEKQYVDVKSANPNVTHIGVNYFQVDPPKNNKTKIGIGLGIGPGVSVHNGAEHGLKVTPSWFTAQVGLQYRF